MSKFLLSILSVFFVCSLSAQGVSMGQPPYLKVPVVPPFKLMLAPDSMMFTKNNLAKNKATIIMVFSPDCEHCVLATENMLANYNKLKKAQIIMATPLAYVFTKKFYKQYKIAAYPAIKLGVDNIFFMGTFFAVKSYPAVFVYDKKGKFKKAFGTDVKFEDVVKEL